MPKLIDVSQSPPKLIQRINVKPTKTEALVAMLEHMDRLGLHWEQLKISVEEYRGC